MQQSPKTDFKYARICLYILAGLAIIYTMYIAQGLVLLLLVTGLVSLLLSPGVKLLQKVFIPRPIGACFLLAALVVPAVLFVAQLQEPMTKWAKLVPELSNQVSEQINMIDEAMDSTTTVKKEETEESSSWFDWFDSSEPEPAPEPKRDKSSEAIKTHLKDSLLSFMSEAAISAPLMLLQLLTSLILIVFTLIYSPKLFQQYVKLFVAESEQNRIKAFALQAQGVLSRYVLTVSLINTCLAIVFVIFLYTMNFQDALIIGVIGGLLNFMPFVGPLLALTLMGLGSFVQWGFDINFFIVVSGVLLITTVESQFVTPLVLAKRMRINPFIIVLWLLLAGWLWGLVGVIIAVPILVCIKLLLEQSESTKRWVAFLST